MIKDFLEKNKERKSFLEHEIKGLLKEAGLAVPEGIFVRAGEEIPKGFALDYPLIAKVSSSKISSKSDVKGIRPFLKNRAELDKALSELLSIENAEGVLVEEQAVQGIEVIVGGLIDDQFGPVVMFGLGGIYVELFKDTAFALAPLSEKDAQWLIKQIKGYKLFKGYRGASPVDSSALLKVILTVSEIISTKLIQEINLNPVMLYPIGAIVLDAKMLAV